MNTWLRAILRVLVGSLVALLILVGSAGPMAAAGVESVALTTPGSFRFAAHGFRGYEAVSTWVTGPRQQVQASGIFDTNGRGAVEFALQMPRHFEAGRWAMTVHGLESGREAIGYFWMPELGPNVPLDVEPAEGARGVTFTFRGRGYRANEQVNYWSTGPTDVAYLGGEARADGGGRVEFRVVLGNEVQPGRWAMSAYGMASGRLGVVQFAVR